jgi:hypothetical protein
METLQPQNTPEVPSLDEGGEVNEQENADTLLESLDTLQFSDKRQVVEFFDKLADADGYDPKALLNELAAKGISSNDYPTSDEYDRSNGETFANQLVGNALHGLEAHGHVDTPVEFHSAVQEWRTDFANNMTSTEETEEIDESDVDKAA